MPNRKPGRRDRVATSPSRNVATEDSPGCNPGSERTPGRFASPEGATYSPPNIPLVILDPSPPAQPLRGALRDCSPTYLGLIFASDRLEYVLLRDSSLLQDASALAGLVCQSSR
jgi:hypothetical protein